MTDLTHLMPDDTDLLGGLAYPTTEQLAGYAVNDLAEGTRLQDINAESLEALIAVCEVELRERRSGADETNPF